MKVPPDTNKQTYKPRWWCDFSITATVFIVYDAYNMKPLLDHGGHSEVINMVEPLDLMIGYVHVLPQLNKFFAYIHFSLVV